MAKTQKILSIFVASPGDVPVERDIVGEFANEWNNLWSDELGVGLKTIKWETHTYPGIGDDGQDVINEQIGEEYDVFLGIMWKRFGTPTARAISGTAEEFTRALARYRNSGTPHLMFYFKKIDPSDSVDTVQSQAVRKFRETLRKEGLLDWSFSLPEQFSQLIRVHLTRHVQAWAKQHHARNSVSQEVQHDLKSRYDNYIRNVKIQTAVLPDIIKQFAAAHLTYMTATKRVSAESKALTDNTPDIVWQLSLIRIVNDMLQYAGDAEKFEMNFSSEFSIFIENLLRAAAVSIALPSVKTKTLTETLAELRWKLHAMHVTTGKYIAELARATPGLSGTMLTANERIIAAHSKFRERTKFGEHLLLESEKLFKTKR